MQTIKWICVYCKENQETPDFPSLDVPDQKKYKDVIKEAAKNGGIACYNCFKCLLYGK